MKTSRVRRNVRQKFKLKALY